MGGVWWYALRNTERDGDRMQTKTTPAEFVGGPKRIRHALLCALRASGPIEVEDEPRAVGDFLAELDRQGFMVMPREPTADILEASMKAMRIFEVAINPRMDKQRTKHVLRYIAMVEVMREKLRNADMTRRAFRQAIERAAVSVLGERVKTLGYVDQPGSQADAK